MLSGETILAVGIETGAGMRRVFAALAVWLLGVGFAATEPQVHAPKAMRFQTLCEKECWAILSPDGARAATLVDKAWTLFDTQTGVAIAQGALVPPEPPPTASKRRKRLSAEQAFFEDLNAAQRYAPSMNFLGDGVLFLSIGDAATIIDARIGNVRTHWKLPPYIPGRAGAGAWGVSATSDPETLLVVQGDGHVYRRHTLLRLSDGEATDIQDSGLGSDTHMQLGGGAWALGVATRCPGATCVTYLVTVDQGRFKFDPMPDDCALESPQLLAGQQLVVCMPNFGDHVLLYDLQSKTARAKTNIPSELILYPYSTYVEQGRQVFARLHGVQKASDFGMGYFKSVADFALLSLQTGNLVLHEFEAVNSQIGRGRDGLLVGIVRGDGSTPSPHYWTTFYSVTADGKRKLQHFDGVGPQIDLDRPTGGGAIAAPNNRDVLVIDGDARPIAIAEGAHSWFFSTNGVNNGLHYAETTWSADGQIVLATQGGGARLYRME